MRICLNMIVKDEAANLPRLFESVAGVADCYVVSDTGSSDDTPALLRRLSEQHGIPGTVTSHPWVDFATNRNLALKDALDARSRGEADFDWLMVLDADEELKVGHEGWRSRLRPRCSHLAYKRARRISYQHDLLLWVEGQAWEWFGAIHSHVRNRGGGHTFVHTDDLTVVYHEFEGAKSRPFSDGREKAAADAARLRQELLGATPSVDNIHRFFQLGYAHRNMGASDDCLAAMHAVAECPGAGREIPYAALVAAGHCLTEAGRPGEEAIMEYRSAMMIDPPRWEAPYHLAVRLRASGDPESARSLLEERLHAGYTDGGLFWKEHEVYEWRLAYELCFLRSLAGAFDDMEALAEGLLDSGLLPTLEKGFLGRLLERRNAISSSGGTDDSRTRESNPV